MKKKNGWMEKNKERAQMTHRLSALFSYPGKIRTASHEPLGSPTSQAASTLRTLKSRLQYQDKLRNVIYLLHFSTYGIVLVYPTIHSEKSS